MFKIIGIGNQLMCDNGIALKVLYEMKEEILKLSDDIKIIFGGTDYMYCLDQIKMGDIVIVIDSSTFGNVPGSITMSLLENRDIKQQMPFLDLISPYQNKMKIYAILIEVKNIEYHNGLSDELSKKFITICLDVFHFIKKIIEVNEDG